MRFVFKLFGVFGTAVALFGAAAWRDKDFHEWTLKDAQQIMTNSPWAKQLPMPAGERPEMIVVEPGSTGSGGAPTASLGNPSNTTTGTNMTVAGNPGSQGPAERGGNQRQSRVPGQSAVGPSPGAPVQPNVITVIWASASPVSLAVAKLHAGTSPVPDVEVQRAFRERETYTMAVVGFPAPNPDTNVNQLATRAFLTVHGRTPIACVRSDYRRIGNSDVYFFRFPKTHPITAVDGDVEFRCSFGNTEVKRKFNVAAMKYEGKPAI